MFFTNLQRLCQMIGETPYSVAKAIGVRSTSTISDWRNGSTPRAKVVDQLVKYFNSKGLAIEAADLFYDADGELEELLERNKRIRMREEIFSNPAKRMLFDVSEDAPDSAIWEAVALITKRKEEQRE